MWKALIAMMTTIIVGVISTPLFAKWINAPEIGLILAVAVMGGFIIYYNDKRQ